MSTRFLRSIFRQPKLPSTNIPGHVKDAATGKLSENSSMQFLWQYRKGSIKRRYATFGKESGLKAGVCYPSKDELSHMKQYEQKFERPFDKMLATQRVQMEKAAEKRTKREIEIRENLAKLPAQKKAFWAAYHELHLDIEKEKSRKDKVIQEVREFLGYDIEPNDPRFEEALLKKDEEEKAAQRAQRKLEKQKQAMEMLQALVSEALEKEKDVQKDAPAKTVSSTQETKKN